MNQILVSEKLYVTPDMKVKKKLFKIEFFLSVFLLFALSSYAIYAAYDRNKTAEVSKDILSGISYYEPRSRTEIEESIVIIVNSDRAWSEATEIQVAEPIPTEQRITAPDGREYYTIGTIRIPELDLDYPILTDSTDELLKVSPGKFWGPNPNEIGNLCIAGHNYQNSKFFSKVPTLENGSLVYITDLSGRTLAYEVYDKYIVDPSDTACTSQRTEGRKEITLITCTRGAKERVIVKAREVVQ